MEAHPFGEAQLRFTEGIGAVGSRGHRVAISGYRATSEVQGQPRRNQFARILIM
jgi:hypothetical protein